MELEFTLVGYDGKEITLTPETVGGSIAGQSPTINLDGPLSGTRITLMSETLVHVYARGFEFRGFEYNVDLLIENGAIAQGSYQSVTRTKYSKPVAPGRRNAVIDFLVASISAWMEAPENASTVKLAGITSRVNSLSDVLEKGEKLSAEMAQWKLTVTEHRARLEKYLADR